MVSGTTLTENNDSALSQIELTLEQHCPLAQTPLPLLPFPQVPPLVGGVGVGGVGVGPPEQWSAVVPHHPY